MSGEEIRDEDLSRFEAELADLVPRRDRLDPRWPSFLARTAALNAAASGDDARTEMTSPCGDDGPNHLYACVYCGTPEPSVSRIRRWTWPAAFAAMTVVAASLLLLVMLPDTMPTEAPLLVAAPNEAETAAVNPPEPSSVAEPKQDPTAAVPDGDSRSMKDVTYASYAGGRWREERLANLAAWDLDLLNEILASKSERPSSGDMVASAQAEIARQPLSAREMLNQVLNHPGPYDVTPEPAADVSSDSQGAEL